MSLPIVIVGAAGRMGRALVQAITQSEDLKLAGAVEHSGSAHLGRDAGELAGLRSLDCPITDRLEPPSGSVVVDFSLALATQNTLERCREHGIPLVLGTTGLRPEDEAALRETATHIAVVRAANYSVGVTLLNELVALTASSVDWEAEIVEIHHRHKRDAPSGTALRLGEAVATARSRRLEDVAAYERHDRDRARRPEEIGMVAMRGGDVVGEHTVMFFGEGERIELGHKATDRTIFARGALRAARWLHGRGSGLHDMVDVLGLRGGKLTTERR